MVYITHIRLSGGTGMQHITHLRWNNTSTGAWGDTTRAGMVEHINQGNAVYAKGSAQDVAVEVVNATPPYLRTVADRYETNNLLSLPHF